MNEATKELKFKTGKDVLEKVCQHFWSDKTSEETENVLTYFYEALELMEKWDDIEAVNNVSHNICEQIKEKVEKLVYDGYSTKATYHRFDETVEWIKHAIFFHTIKYGSNVSEKFEKDVDTSTSITYPYEYWIWLNDVARNIITITKDAGVYNNFMNCVYRSKFRYVEHGQFSMFYTRRRSLVRYNMYRTGEYNWNAYAGAYQPVNSSKITVKNYFLNCIFDNTKSIYSGKPNGEPRLALAYPEYFGAPDKIHRKDINLSNVILEAQFKHISHTRTPVHIKYREDGIDIIYKEYDNEVESLNIGGFFKIDNECRYWELEREGNKYFFRKYRNNGDLLNEVYIRKGDWLLASTSGACRNGMFHPANPFPIQVHFINHNLSHLIRESIPSWAKEIGSINGCAAFGDGTFTKGESVYIKNRSKYYPLIIECYSEANTNEAQEEFEKDFNNGDWKNEKFSIYRGHLLIKDL